MTEYDLLRKTEMVVEGIALAGANLNDVAATAAGVLGFEEREVLVTDYQENRLTIDVLRSSVDAHAMVGKEQELLRSLGELPGVTLEAGATVSSQGMLGWIAFDTTQADEALRRAERTAEEIRSVLSRRAVVFSTGREVIEGEIEDTNWPVVSARLRSEGFSVDRGPTLADDRLLIAAALWQAAGDDGYGLIVTTGGVGAEAKDRTVEAVLALDAEAATPYICRFEVGTGRHHKDGVRIAVGEWGGALIVALPGPNDEVRASLDVLVAGLRQGLDKRALADGLAASLRGVLKDKMSHPGGALRDAGM